MCVCAHAGQGYLSCGAATHSDFCGGASDEPSEAHTTDANMATVDTCNAIASSRLGEGRITNTAVLIRPQASSAARPVACGPSTTVLRALGGIAFKTIESAIVIR